MTRFRPPLPVTALAPGRRTVTLGATSAGQYSARAAAFTIAGAAR